MLKSKNIKKNTIIATEFENYEYYKTRGLRNFHVSYISDDNISYGFVVNNNELFKELLNFYLEYVDLNSIINIV